MGAVSIKAKHQVGTGKRSIQNPCLTTLAVWEEEVKNTSPRVFDNALVKDPFSEESLFQLLHGVFQAPLSSKPSFSRLLISS